MNDLVNPNCRSCCQIIGVFSCGIKILVISGLTAEN